MQSSKQSKKAQKFIALNFIIKLLLSKNPIIKVDYNSILIIINKLIKYIYFINYIKALNAEDLICTFLQIIFANYNISAEIISN